MQKAQNTQVHLLKVNHRRFNHEDELRDYHNDVESRGDEEKVQGSTLHAVERGMALLLLEAF